MNSKAVTGKNGTSSNNIMQRRAQPGFELVIKLAMPFTFGFLILLVVTEFYGLSQIPQEVMTTPFSVIMTWIVSLSIVFSLVVFALVLILIKALRLKTIELEKQKDHLEQLVKQKTDELLNAEKLTAIGELAARIAHDIRNPLSVIMNSFEILKMKNHADEKTVQHYDRINKAISRIAHQINDVMDYVKDNPIKKDACLVSDIIAETLESIRIPDRIKLKIYDTDIPLECDLGKMVVVFKNLLLNSIQALNEEGKISIRVIEKGGRIVIEIEDSGPKIPQEVLPRIFEPLFTTKQQGTGLGLSICKRIIEKHGGTIAVKNNENVGKTFTIELPKIHTLFGVVNGEKNAA